MTAVWPGHWAVEQVPQQFHPAAGPLESTHGTRESGKAVGTLGLEMAQVTSTHDPHRSEPKQTSPTDPHADLELCPYFTFQAEGQNSRRAIWNPAWRFLQKLETELPEDPFKGLKVHHSWALPQRP